MPVDKEQLIITKISGLTIWNTAFRNQVGMQSEGQVDDFESKTVRSKVKSKLKLKVDRSKNHVPQSRVVYLHPRQGVEESVLSRIR